MPLFLVQEPRALVLADDFVAHLGCCGFLVVGADDDAIHIFGALGNLGVVALLFEFVLEVDGVGLDAEAAYDDAVCFQSAASDEGYVFGAYADVAIVGGGGCGGLGGRRGLDWGHGYWGCGLYGLDCCFLGLGFLVGFLVGAFSAFA